MNKTNMTLLLAPSLDELLSSTGSAGALKASSSSQDTGQSAVETVKVVEAPAATGSSNEDENLPGLEIDPNEVTTTGEDGLADDYTVLEDDTEVGEDGKPKKLVAKDEDFGDRLKDKTSTKDKSKVKVKTKGAESSEEDTDDTGEDPKDKSERLLQTRDFTGFDTKEVAVLKQMSKDAFAYVAPVLKEYKALKPQIESLKSDLEAAKKSPPAEAYFDEYGYASKPEFHQAVEEESTAQQFIDFYNQQLISLETTDKFVGLVLAPDGKSWNQVPVVCKDVTEQAQYRVMLNNIIRDNGLKVMQAGQRKEQIRSTYQNNVQQSRAVITQMERKAFGKYVGKEKENQLISTMLQTLGELGQGNNPLKNIVAYLYAEINEMAKQLAAKPAATTTQQPAAGATARKAAPASNIDPSSASISSGAGTPSKNKNNFAKDDLLQGRFGG